MSLNPLIFTVVLAMPFTAAAQAVLHGAVMGVNTSPMIVAGLNSPIQNIPVLSPSAIVMSPSLASIGKPALSPAAQIMAGSTIKGSPLAVIQSKETGAAKGPALNTLYDGLAQREAAAAINLSNEFDRHAPGISLTMYQDLLKALKPDQRPVTDVRDLRKLGARADLLERGFKLDFKSGGMEIYVLGNRSNGQRATYINGAVSLVSFTRPSPKDFPTYQIISLDDSGYIFNELVFPSR